jgi:hypothetical protein
MSAPGYVKLSRQMSTLRVSAVRLSRAPPDAKRISQDLWTAAGKQDYISGHVAFAYRSRRSCSYDQHGMASAYAHDSGVTTTDRRTAHIAHVDVHRGPFYFHALRGSGPASASLLQTLSFCEFTKQFPKFQLSMAARPSPHLKHHYAASSPSAGTSSCNTRSSGQSRALQSPSAQSTATTRAQTAPP